MIIPGSIAKDNLLLYNDRQVKEKVIIKGIIQKMLCICRQKIKGIISFNSCGKPDPGE